MANHEFTIKFKLSEKDILLFQVSYLLRQWYVWIVVLASLSATGVIISRLFAGELSEVPSQAWFFSPISIFMLLMLFISSKRSIKNKFVNEEKLYTISEQYFILESESTTQRVLWHDFIKYFSNRKFLYLFISSNSAHVIPLDTLSSDDKQFLNSIIKSKVKKQKLGSLIYIFIFFVLFVVLVGIIQFLSSQSS